jgi:hypothetical protein
LSFCVNVKKNFVDVGGMTLVHVYYHKSVPLLLSTMYPEYNWLPWKFQQTPKNFWSDINNQRKFVEWVGKELKIKDMCDWYNVTLKVTIKCYRYSFLKDFEALGCYYLLQNRYNGVISAFLSAVYPEHEWLPWKFVNIPKHFWNDIKNQKSFFDWAGKQLGVKELSDWKKVSIKVLSTPLLYLIIGPNAVGGEISGLSLWILHIQSLIECVP